MLAALPASGAFFARWLGETNPVGPGSVREARDPRFVLPAGIAMLATGMIAFYDTVSPFDLEVAFGLGKAQFGNLSLGLSVACLVGALAVNRWVAGLASRFDAVSLLLAILVRACRSLSHEGGPP